MHITRFHDAKPYDAPGHAGMSMLRLQGREAGPSDTLWLGASHFLPGGHTTLDASPIEKMYVVLAGELHISNGVTEEKLGLWDTCRIAPGEARAITNRSNFPATLLLAMPHAAASKT
jgi:hypothetical protein